MKKIYGEPPRQQMQMMAGIYTKSYRQARLLADIMSKACADYVGKSEETLIAKWHDDAIYNIKRSQTERWIGWEDGYPVEPKEDT